VICATVQGTAMGDWGEEGMVARSYGWQCSGSIGNWSPSGSVIGNWVPLIIIRIVTSRSHNRLQNNAFC